MFADRMAEGGSQLAAGREVGELLGIKQETLRNWIRRDLGEGSTPVASQTSSEELIELRKENTELRRTNEILNTYISSHPPQDLVGPTQFAILLLQGLHPHRLRPIPELVSDPLDRALGRAHLRPQRAHHPHRCSLLLLTIPDVGSAHQQPACSP